MEKKYVTLEDGTGERYRVPEDKVQQAMDTFAQQRRLAKKTVELGLGGVTEDFIRQFDLRIVKDEE